MADRWNNANNDVLEEIAERLHSYSEYVQFRSVCRSWRTLPKIPKKLPRGVPCLVFPREDTHSDFFSLFVGQCERYKLEVPNCRAHVCKGSSHGWLITVSESLSIHLNNPLTNAHMQLPPITTFEGVLNCNPKLGLEYLVVQRYAIGSDTSHRNSTWMHQKFIQKVVLSSSPRARNCVAMAIYGKIGNLAYCRRGDNKWTTVKYNWFVLSCLQDILQYNGKFYAVDDRRRVFVVDINSSGAEARLLVDERNEFYNNESKAYLAVSNGNLLIINRCRMRLNEKYQTVKFQVFWCNVNSKANSRISEVESLGDNLVFLGQNQSFCISARDVPRPPKWNSMYWNAIYFTDEDGCSDYGVFHLDDGSLHRFPVERSRSTWHPPIWMTPNLS